VTFAVSPRSARLTLARASRMPTSLGTTTFSIVVGGAVDVVATVVATVGREKLEVDAGVAWPGSLVGLSSLKATAPKRTSRAARTTYQRRHHGPLDDGPLGGGIPNPPEAVAAAPNLPAVLPVIPSPDPAVGRSLAGGSALGRRWSPALRIDPSIRHGPPVLNQTTPQYVTGVQEALIVTPTPIRDIGSGDSNSGPPPGVVTGRGLVGA
jgi:hypothetical protein